MSRLAQALLGALGLLRCCWCRHTPPHRPPRQRRPPAPLPTRRWRATLPADIRWITNEEDPPIGSAKALRGGTLNSSIDSYPLTFRLVGPNSNDAFAGWNRQFTMDFPLVIRHPSTDRFIPWMATHWSIAADQRTLYFKLDRDARFSDGKPVTAHDYVFTWRMMQSEHIVSPVPQQLRQALLRIGGRHR